MICRVLGFLVTMTPRHPYLTVAAWAPENALMIMRHEDLLSVGYVTPGWPMGSLANGIIPYVEAMYQNLDRMGHRVSVVSRTPIQRVDERVYEACVAGKPKTKMLRAMDATMFRLARTTRIFDGPRTIWWPRSAR